MDDIERVLDELRDMRTENREVRDKLVALATRMEDVPELKAKVAGLERWRWTAMGALGASGASLATQLYSALKGV